MIRPKSSALSALVLPFLAIAPLRAQDAEPAASGPNILFVTMEAARTDRLGCYGREGSVTPRLDALAAEGALFERAYAHAPILLPACASLLTGVTPLAHGLHEDGRAALGPELPTLAERLKASGYRTAAFQGSIELAPLFGLARGFDHYDDEMGNPEDMKAFTRERRARFVVGAFLDWQAQGGEGPFFAWLHLPDARFPYAPPPDLSELSDAYDGELAAIDRELGRLLDALGAGKVLDSTIVVVAGTMGEALGDQGEATHGLTLQESVVRVPLVVRLPGAGEDGRRIALPVGQSDLMPTLLALAGAPAVERAEGYAPFAGRSVAALLASADASVDARDVYLESEVGARQFGWNTLRGLVRGEHKLVLGASANLYDVVADAREVEDRAGAEPELAAAMNTEIARLLAASRALAPGTTPAFDPLVERMAAILSTLPDAMHGAALRETEALDPRTQLAAWNAYTDALQAAWSGNPRLIPEPLERAVAASFDTAMLHLLLAVALERNSRFQDAVTHLETALEIDPGLALAHYYLGRSHSSLGNPGEAESHYALALDLDPDQELARRALSRRMLESGRIEEARPHCVELIRLLPDDVTLWKTLVDIDRYTGDWARLSETLAAGVARHPQDLHLRNYQAWVLATAPLSEVRDPDRAVALAEAMAGETAEQDPGILDTLAAAYASAGRYEEAVRMVGRAVSMTASRNLTQLVEQMRARLALYQQQTPYFEK